MVGGKGVGKGVGGKGVGGKGVGGKGVGNGRGQGCGQW